MKKPFAGMRLKSKISMRKTSVMAVATSPSASEQKLHLGDIVRIGVLGASGYTGAEVSFLFSFVTQFCSFCLFFVSTSF